MLPDPPQPNDQPVLVIGGLFVDAAIAWRIMAMTLPGQRVPGCGVELLFTDHEPNCPSRCAIRSRLEGLRDSRLRYALVVRLGGRPIRVPGPDHVAGRNAFVKAAAGHQIRPASRTAKDARPGGRKSVPESSLVAVRQR